jgi:4-alpha-glucanotransferase
LRAELNLLEDAQVINQLRLDRATQKQQLLERIIKSGGWKGEPHAAAIPLMTGALNEAIHGYLALSSAAILMCQIEDLLLMQKPVNVPGTFKEYRNWQRKLKYTLEDLFERSEVKRLLSRLSSNRRK